MSEEAAVGCARAVSVAFSFELLHQQFSLEHWETTLRTKKNAKNSKEAPGLHTLRRTKKYSQTEEKKEENEDEKKGLSFVGQLDLLTQTQEIIDIAINRLQLEIPFYQPLEEDEIMFDDIDQTCECLFGFMESISRKTAKNFLEIRCQLGRKYDNLIEILVETFKHARRVKRTTNSLLCDCNEFKDLVYKFENNEHHIRKYKNVSSEVVEAKAKELEVNKNMLCMWDHKLETLLIEVSRAITSAYEFALLDSQVQFSVMEVQNLLRANSPTKLLRKSSRFSTHSMSIERETTSTVPNIGSGSRRSSPTTDRSKSLSMSYDGSPFVRSLSRDTEYPKGIDPLIVFWLRKYSFSQYLPLFASKNLTFLQFSQMKDIHFAEFGVKSGEDCISLGMLLSNTRGPGNSIVVHESFMSKRGNIRKSWKKRFFRLVSTYEVFYYSKPESSKPIGSIDLLQVSSVSRLPGNVLQENSFYFYFQLVTKDRCWLLSGDDVLVEQWSSLLKHIVLYSKQNNITRSVSSS